MLRALKNDLATYRGDWTQIGFWAMVVYRFGQYRYCITSSWLRKPLSLIYKVMFKIIQVLGIELPCEVPVGEGLRIDHTGGIVVSGFASLGHHCVLRNGVTIGLRNEAIPAAPTIGNHVSFGAGSKCLGPITIGDYVEIGANAVVLQDVPSHHIAVGIPARILPKAFQNAPH